MTRHKFIQAICLFYTLFYISCDNRTKPETTSDKKKILKKTELWVVDFKAKDTARYLESEFFYNTGGKDSLSKTYFDRKEKQRREIFYNSRGDIQYEKGYDTSGSLQSTVEYRYDVKGLKTDKITSTDTYYDGKFIAHNTDGWHDKFTYDKSNNLIERRKVDKKYPDYSYDVYYYDSTNRVTEMKMCGNGKSIWIIRYKYDYRGNQVLTCSTNEKGVLSSINMLEYDTLNNKIKMHEYTINDRDTTYSISTYAYKNGKQTEEIYYENGIEKKATTYIQYDKFGNKIKTAYNNLINGKEKKNLEWYYVNEYY